MKKEKIVLTILLCAFIFMFAGCATTDGKGRYPTIEEAYPDRFDKTKMGMTLDEFKTVWPEAKKTGETQTELVYAFSYGHITIYAPDYTIIEKFYFTNNKLTKYDNTRQGGL
ncbi:MAG: hypothetical protein Ta2B_05560 [Termitinemataceae bacterium]|nr:MAG: hypothetical protein Ta2B_05560 [Termitinemataceae bacterium]